MPMIKALFIISIEVRRKKNEKNLCSHNSVLLGNRQRLQGPPTQVEDGNLRLSPRFLVHHPVTSPPTNQKKATHPEASPQILPIKLSPPPTMEDFRILGTKHSSPLYWRVYSKCCVFLHYSPMSVAWSEQIHLVQ